MHLSPKIIICPILSTLHCNIMASLNTSIQKNPKYSQHHIRQDRHLPHVLTYIFQHYCPLKIFSISNNYKL